MTTSSRFFIACACLLAAGRAAFAQSASLDFETAGQFTGNFRGVSLLGGSAAQSSNGASNDFVKHDRTTSTDKGVAYVYDTTPGDATIGTQSTFVATSPLTASFDLYAAPALSSFGIILADASNASNNIMAQFVVNFSGATDSFRFFRDGTVSGADLTAGTQVGTTSNLATSIGTGTAFTTGGGFSVALTFVGDTPTLSLTAGGETVSQSFSSTDINWTNTTVILRLYDSGAGTGSGVGIDNFVISTIPEPSGMAAIFSSLAFGFCAFRRRRG